MFRPRVIPCLLLINTGLVKTVKFKDPKYLGDPINTVKIFNDKCVDELIILDITATTEKKQPQLNLISRIASEAFMPLCYGGGIKTIEDIKKILALGVEKVSINSSAVENPALITQASEIFGSQSIVVSIDVKKNFWGKYEVVTHRGKKSAKIDPVQFAKEIERYGAGEILINSVDRDGTMNGYDIDLIKKVSEAVSIPVIAFGGAGSVNDLAKAVFDGGASAVAAGSMFVFTGKYRAVLITFPAEEELVRVLDYHT